jgi:hypothetical protein
MSAYPGYPEMGVSVDIGKWVSLKLSFEYMAGMVGDKIY